MFEDPAEIDFRPSAGATRTFEARPGDRVVTRRTRLEQAEHNAAAEARLAAGETQRAAATVMDVPRSTLRGWCGDVPGGDPPTGLAAFARTPDGIAWLHRMVLAAHFSITLRAAGGGRHPAGE